MGLIQWHSKSDTISFGHDIKVSLMLCVAAEMLGDATLSKSVQQVALKNSPGRFG